MTAGLVLAAGIAAGALANPGEAGAWNVTPCPGAWGPIVYNYHSYAAGALNCQDGNVPDLSSPAMYFNHTNPDADNPNDGLGKPLWNDAGSGENWDLTCTAHIWYHANYTGSQLTLSPFSHSGWYSNTLGVVNNNNRSQSWNC